MSIPFDNTYCRLPERFFVKTSPAGAPAPALIRANSALADELGIEADWLESEEGVAVVSGNAVAEGSEPIAQAYAGHQFGGFSPQLGDGRALLLGEVVDTTGRRRDLQLKGSGRTAFSRGGDGKSALGPVLREYLVSEAMFALGVPTTRALAAVTTGEKVLRQEGHVAGGIFTRVAASHIRVGTFQYFLARNDTEGLQQLADYVIARHYPEAADAEVPVVALLESVVSAQADLIAHWMSLGFIHGVMNTDNCAVSGETIDYGPCAFMDAFHPKCVFSSIDRGARYAWGNQADIGLWNLTRFAETLLPLLGDGGDSNKATDVAETALGAYPERFGKSYAERFRAKLGLPDAASEELAKDVLGLMAVGQVDFTVFFRRLTEVAAGADKEKLGSLFTVRDGFDDWFFRWSEATGEEVWIEAMRAANPVLIPRNHRIEQAIQSGSGGDFAPFHRLVDAWAQPFAERAEYADLELPPRPEEVVRETFCGT